MSISKGRIKREEFAHYLNCTPHGAPSYERIGVGNDGLTRTKNMEVNKTRDVTGNNEITVNKGDEQVDVSPYYAKRGTKLFDFIMNLDDTNAELDETKTDYIEVKAWEGEDGNIVNEAYKWECFIEISEVGGDTTGFQIPFNIHLGGVKTKGTWDPSAKTFTAG